MNVEPTGDWSEQAACKRMDPNLWFPVRGGSDGFALEVCGMCPVKQECAEYAIPDPSLHGIWGGLSREQRERERSRRAKRLRPAKDPRTLPWRDREPPSLEQMAARAAMEYRS